MSIAIVFSAIAGFGWSAAPPAAESACGLALPRTVQQGQLVRGRARPDARVRIADRTLRLDREGRFVFGVGRDQTAVKVFVATADACMAVLEPTVTRRTWQVERVDGLPPKTVDPDPETARRIAAEAALIKAARTADSAATDWQAALQWPAQGRISGIYGSQRVLNGSPKDPHLGLDIAAPTGTLVRAPWAGTVRLVHPDMVLTGGTLLLDHGHGVSTIYIHLSRIDVADGQRVQAGDPIAAIGATGRASGPHLHFQLHWFQEKLDPALLLSPHPSDRSGQARMRLAPQRIATAGAR